MVRVKVRVTYFVDSIYPPDNELFQIEFRRHTEVER